MDTMTKELKKAWLLGYLVNYFDDNYYLKRNFNMLFFKDNPHTPVGEISLDEINSVIDRFNSIYKKIRLVCYGASANFDLVFEIAPR